MPRLSDVSLLHPTFRKMALGLEAEMAAAQIPLRIYETARTPWRQAELYAVGRSTGERGHTVTRAQAWSSFHNFALAADFVFLVDGRWTWNEPKPGMWQAFTAAAEKIGLRTLSFERPHVEYPARIADLQFGRMPVDGDDAWRAWLETQIEQWGRQSREVGGIVHPGAPVEFLQTGARPHEGVA